MAGFEGQAQALGQATDVDVCQSEDVRGSVT